MSMHHESSTHPNTPAHHNIISWANATEGLTLRQGLLMRLSDAYQRCSDTTVETELVLVSGPSGVGKTTLALDLKEEVVAGGGYFISGKLDLLEASWHGSSLYGPYVDAFTEYIEMVVDAGEETVKALRLTLEAKMDLTELQVLRDMIPVLRKILGVPPETAISSERSSVIKGPEAESRFIRVFSLFVRSICSLQHPIVLFIDDIQWANQCEVALLSSLASLHGDSPMSSFMLLCTLRTDEVTLTHPIFAALDEMRRQGTRVNEIEVSNMTEDEVNSVILRVVHLSPDDARCLSELVFRQTHGNLLFVVMLVTALHQEGILHYRGSGDWDCHKVSGKISAFRSAHQLIVRNIERLPEPAQELLKTASCLGPSFSFAVLSPMDIVDDDSLLWSVLVTIEEAGLISLKKESGTGRFAHDRIQKAAYSLVPSTGREAIHLEIGRRLWKSAPRSQHDEHLFLIAQQVSRGVHLVYNPVEQREFAEMFYNAGQKAAISSAFVTSAKYLNMGISLLSRRRWKDQYQLSLRLYNLAAEIEYYNGNFQRMDELIAAVFKNARSLDDKLRAHFTRIYSLGTRNETERALDESLEVLKSLGETFPRRPNILHVIVGTLRLRYLFFGRTDADVLNLSLMTDSKKVASMRLLCIIAPFAFYKRNHLSALITFRMVENTIRSGLIDMGSYGFAALSIACMYGGDLRNASRFSKLVLITLDKFHSKEWKARVTVLIWSIHYPLLHPFRDSLEPLKDAHRIGLVVGDIYFSLVSASAYCGLAFSAGLPLPRLVEEMRKFRSLCTEYSQLSVMATLSLRMQMCLNLMGQSDNLLVLTGEVMNEDEALTQLETSNHIDLERLHIYKLTLAVYLNDHAAAQGMCGQLRQFEEVKTIPYSAAAQLFYEGLTAARASVSSYHERKRAKSIILKLKRYANSAPCNYLHRVFLVEAELLAADSNNSNHGAAIEKYDMAIDHARHEGLIHEHALACERKAHALARTLHHTEARTCLEQACSLYEEWGAQAKVDQLSALLRYGNGGIFEPPGILPFIP